mmetsp:Transcript_28677/g.92504  ORF Transcript_28677/g.92504 Transcript_28677/m.92504 type:complete len:104 (+) Transcript_28677:370-681(+)
MNSTTTVTWQRPGSWGQTAGSSSWTKQHVTQACFLKGRPRASAGQLKGRAVVALAVENLGEKERVKGRHFRGLRGSKLGTCDVDHFPHDKNSDGSTSAASGSA